MKITRKEIHQYVMSNARGATWKLFWPIVYPQVDNRSPVYKQTNRLLGISSPSNTIRGKINQDLL